MYKATLSIVKFGPGIWNANTAKYDQPKNLLTVPQKIKVNEGQIISLGASNDPFFKVLSVDKDFVTLQCSGGLFRKIEDETRHLSPDTKNILVKINETLKLVAQTSDVEYSWEIKLDDVSEEQNTPEQKQTSKIRVPKTYFKETQSIITQLETQLSTKIVVYYIPPRYHIDQEHPDYFLDLLNSIGYQEKLSVLVYSTGGNPMASLRIATVLRSYCKTLEVIVASRCASAATELALAADKIIFTPLGYLSPIDSQIVGIRDQRLTDYSYDQISFASFKKARDLLENEKKANKKNNDGEGALETLFKYVHPLVYAEIDRLSKRSKLTAETMMKMHPNTFSDTEKISEIANHLVYDYPDHGFPIQYSEAKAIGLPAEQASAETSTILWHLLKYYKSITREAYSSYSAGTYHVEENSVVMETLGQRVANRYSFNRRPEPGTGKWQIENDNTQWVRMTESVSGDKTGIVLTPMELENESNQKPPSIDSNPVT